MLSRRAAQTRSGRALRLAALASVLGLVLAACTSDGGPGEPPPATGGGRPCAEAAGLTGPIEDRGIGAASDGAITLEASEFAFDPTCVEASGGATLEVTVRNVGSALHNLRIDSLGIDQDVQPGETITVEVTLPSSGPVPFVCKYHIANGMQGAFLTS